MLSTRSAKLTAIPGPTGWAQVHEFTPEDPEKVLARGHLVAIVATKRVEEGVEIASAGRELLARLHEEYFGSLEAKPFNALKNAVEKVSKEFKESWGDVEIVAGALVGEVVFSAASGGGRVVICRGGALGTILDSRGDGVISASGYPKSSDVMLLATHAFFERVPQGVVKAALGSATPEEAIETFAPSVHEEEVGSLGVAVIKFEEKDAVSESVSEVAVPAKLSLPFAGKVSNFLRGVLKKIPQRGIYVKPQISEEIPTQSKKVTFSVALVLIFVLAVSIVFGIRQKRATDLKNKYQGMLAQAASEVDQAISLASVSPDRSRELFSDSEAKLSQILALNVRDPQVEALKNKIESSRASILGEYDTLPELFLDLTLLSSGFKGDVVSASGGNIYVLDRSGNRVISAAIDTKKSSVVAGPSIVNGATDLASYEDRVFDLEGDGIYEITGGEKTKIISKSWGGAAFIRAFAGNIYVLDRSGNAIYRFPGSGSVFGEKANWLAAGTSTDFSGVAGFEIDGSIYVLYPNSKVLKYSLGSPQAFNLTGVVPEIGKIDAIYADSDNSDLYFLDRAGKRVVVTDKSGKYLAQYLSDQIGQAVGLVVSEASKKIILSTGDKLLSVDIKHLQ